MPRSETRPEARHDVSAARHRALSRRLPRPRGGARAGAGSRQRARAALARFADAGLSDAARGGLALHRSAPVAAHVPFRRPQRAAAPRPEPSCRWRFAGASHRLVFVDGALRAGTLRDRPACRPARGSPRRRATLAERPELVEQALDENDTRRRPALRRAQRRALRRRLRARARRRRRARPSGRDHPSRPGAERRRSFHLRSASLLGAGQPARR